MRHVGGVCCPPKKHQQCGMETWNRCRVRWTGDLTLWICRSEGRESRGVCWAMEPLHSRMPCRCKKQKIYRSLLDSAEIWGKNTCMWHAACLIVNEKPTPVPKMVGCRALILDESIGSCRVYSLLYSLVSCLALHCTCVLTPLALTQTAVFPGNTAGNIFPCFPNTFALVAQLCEPMSGSQQKQHRSNPDYHSSPHKCVSRHQLTSPLSYK